MARRVKYILARIAYVPDDEFASYTLFPDTAHVMRILGIGSMSNYDTLFHAATFCPRQLESITSIKLKAKTAQRVRITPLKSGGFSFKLTGKPFDIK